MMRARHDRGFALDAAGTRAIVTFSGSLALALCAASLTAQEPDPIPAGVAPPPGVYAPGVDAVHYEVEVGLGYGVLWFVGVAGTWMIRKISPGRLEEAGVDQAMGGGDVKMMMMVGAFVGAWGVMETLFIGSVLALLVFAPLASETGCWKVSKSAYTTTGTLQRCACFMNTA